MQFDTEEHKQLTLAILNSDLAVPVKLAQPLASLKQAVEAAEVAAAAEPAAPKTGKRAR